MSGSMQCDRADAGARQTEVAQAKAGKGASKVGCPPHRSASRLPGVTSDPHSAKSSGHMLAAPHCPPRFLCSLNVLSGQLLLCALPSTASAGCPKAQNSDLISICASLGGRAPFLVFMTISMVMTPA